MNPMNPVAAGDGRYYKFTPALGSADTYWYHPHAHGVTAGQVHRGLAYRSPSSRSCAVNCSRATHFPVRVEARCRCVHCVQFTEGREGQYVLVNGALRSTFDVRPGETQRWKLFNATSARYIRFALDDHAITLIGTDGGLLAALVARLTVLLFAPAQRSEIIVTTNVSGLSQSATSNLRALA